MTKKTPKSSDLIGWDQSFGYKQFPPGSHIKLVGGHREKRNKGKYYSIIIIIIEIN